MLRGQNSSSMLALNTTSSSEGSANALDMDALPKQFVLSMKKLFDILDDKQSGYVRFADIEKGWQDDGSKGLPRGVLDSLRRVTPSCGLLSFDRFCAGLKLCLLRNQQQQQQQQQHQLHNNEKLTKSLRPPSAPQLDNNVVTPAAPLAKVRPRSQVPLSPGPEMEYSSPAPPPKPPRQVVAKADIRHALQNWQLNMLSNERDRERDRDVDAKQKLEHRGSADGGSSSASASATDWGLALPPKKTNSKRRESRRHTLQHGIDYNMLKRMKQLEEQRELLLFGLEGVEKARDWYMQQVFNIQEQIKYFGRLGNRFEQWSELQQERLNFQRARVLEANRSLAILTDTWEHGGYPLHINLALPDLLGRGVAGRRENKSPLLSDLYDHNLRAMSNFVLSQPSPVSQSSAGLGDADVVY